VLGCIVGAHAASQTPGFGETITRQDAIKNLADHGLHEQAVARKDAIADDDERIEKNRAPRDFADRPKTLEDHLDNRWPKQARRSARVSCSIVGEKLLPTCLDMDLHSGDRALWIVALQSRKHGCVLLKDPRLPSRHFRQHF
jgi:hypothetical protein